MANRPLLWWHFSDLHWDVRSSTERRGFLKVLYDDLRQRIAEHGVPDFVAFSGDISFSGEEAQYLAAEQEFFNALRTMIGVAECPFLFVPGNHDVRRALAKIVNPELIVSLNSTRSLNDFLDVEDYLQMVRRPFSAFDGFASRIMPPVNQDPLGWSYTLGIRGRAILMVGLNSAWASTYHKSLQGAVEDERHLLLGQRQFLSLTEASGKADLTIVIVHHPLKWLNGFSETQSKQLLLRYADLVLFGHTHDLHDLSFTLGATGSTVFLPAPAIYDRAPTDTVEYARGYNIVSFDLETRRGAAHYYKYSGVYATKFDPFVELYSTPGQAHFEIDLPVKPGEPVTAPKPRFHSFSDVLTAFPQLARLNGYLESRLDASALERHTIEYFEALIIELVHESDLVDQDLPNVFWEAVVVCRALLYCDLIQLNSLGSKPYLPRQSVDRLCDHLADTTKEVGSLQLTIDEHRRLYGLAFDSCSFSGGSVSSISESYRRLFALPWALSRLLLYLDYPELIPAALRWGGRRSSKMVEKR